MENGKIKGIPLKEDSLLMISVLTKGFLRQPTATWVNVMNGYRDVLEKGEAQDGQQWEELTRQILANITAREVRLAMGRRLTEMERLFVSIHVENFIRTQGLLKKVGDGDTDSEGENTVNPPLPT